MKQSSLTQTIRPAFWCVAGITLGGLLASGIGTFKQDRLRSQNDRLRGELAALDAEHAASIQRLDRVRSETALLREQMNLMLAAPTADVNRSATADKAKSTNAAVAIAKRPEAVTTKRLALAEVPAEVQSALVRKAGTVDIHELEQLTEDGQLFYQIQGLTEDGRRIGLRISPEGNIISGKSEITAEDLPPTVRDVIAQTWGEVDLQNAREIFQNDQATYELGGRTADGRKFKLSLADAGSILAADTEVQLQNLPQPVQQALAENVEPGAGTAIREIYEADRVTYDVGVKTDTGKSRLVIAPDGTLVGFESWLRQPKPEKKFQ